MPLLARRRRIRRPSRPRLVHDLTTIGGQPLPFELQSALADRINLTGALLVLEPDGTYSLTILTEILNAGEITDNSSGEIGDWRQSGSQVALVSRFEDKTTTASIQGGTMTIAAYAITLFFGENDSDAFVLSGLTLVERQGQSP